MQAEQERTRMLQEAWQAERAQLERASERGGKALLEMKEPPPSISPLSPLSLPSTSPISRRAPLEMKEPGRYRGDLGEIIL